MLFSSLIFLFFFLVITVAVYYILPRSLRNIWLFIASLFFYGYGEPIYVLLMLFSITANYIFGILIGRTKAKKLWLILGITVNLALLCYFKYMGFLSETLKNVFASMPIFNIALPIGISFYTFQTMSYLIDVYRGDCSTQTNYIIFGTYVTMFPQLIAGPIVRYKDVEYQLNNRKESFDMFSNGVRLFTVGLAKKVLLANTLGGSFDSLLQLSDLGTLGHFVAMICFTLQIYFDFSGYSDMARGLGNMFGFTFVKNFDYPYTSKSITEFWRRWHISLGTWFKEYVYIPLGGNRNGAFKQIINIMIVWALTGFWHGASWNFLFWGMYYGILLIIEKLFLLKVLKKIPNAVKVIYTLVFVSFGWMLFNFTNTNDLFNFLSGIFSISASSASEKYIIITSLPIILISCFASLPYIKRAWTYFKNKKRFVYFEAICVLIILILCVASLVSTTYNPFLYFRF